MGRFERYGQRVSAGDISGGPSEPDRNVGDTGRERDLGYGGPRQDRSNAIADKINKEREEKKKAKAEIFRNTGVSDPEKADYFDPTYVSKETGKTVGQMQAEAKTAGLAGMAQRSRDMNRAMEMADKVRSNKTGQVNLNQLSDQDLEFMRDAGLFAGEAEGVLGGVAGIEKVTNESKQELINLRREIGKKIDQETGGKLSDEEWNKRVSELLNKDPRAQQLGILFGGLDNALRSTYGTKDTPGVGFDPTGMLSLIHI